MNEQLNRNRFLAFTVACICYVMIICLHKPEPPNDTEKVERLSVIDSLKD